MIIVAPGSCKTEDLSKTGWWKCPTFPYIKGLKRKKTSKENKDTINNLEGARCCEGFKNIKSECVEVDWATSFDK